MPPIVDLTGSVPPDTAALVVLVAPDGGGGAVLDPAGRAALAAFGADPASLEAVLVRDSVKGEPGQAATVPVGDRMVVAVGVGAGSPRDYRRAAAAAVRRLKTVPGAAVVIPRRTSATRAQALTEGLLLGGYSFRITKRPKPEPLAAVHLVTDRVDALSPAVDAGVSIAAATRFARDLASTPSSTKSPAWLARQAQDVAKRAGLEVRIRAERELRAEGFGGIVAVGMGSANPPRLIELSYAPADPVPGHVVLIGKGITFDSGGLSLKQNANMVAMKTDMAAGGAVVAVMSALGELGVRVRVTGLVPAAENMPSGSAQRPSDVIAHYGGTTTEVLNTDAEGRLVLADALAYADAELDPDVVIDLATLTGAMTTALGRRHAGLFSADDRLARALLTAAAAAGEGLWRMPLVEDYRVALDSPVADLTNVAATGAHFSAGAIMAALFLREFAGQRRWAHLDIAGAARADADEHEIVKGPTGYGVRLLLHWLTAADPLRGLRSAT